MSALLLAALAAAPSLPIDCLPDAVDAWQVRAPETRFGATSTPGVVLGVPADSGPTVGSTTVASLGVGGAMVFALGDIVIEDRPGPDFIVFENAFFQGAPPAGPEDDYFVFHEPGFVEVSADGEAWLRFPYDAAALEESRALGAIDRDLHRRLAGLAGVTPTFSGNWTLPNVSEAFDPGGTGGVSGAGGDAFDLADVGLSEARFVRVVDAEVQNGFAGSAEGFDLDALVVLHGRPRATAAPDGDGDGLPDALESALYGTRVDLADSDFDGTNDGREVAGCRDPLSDAVEPWLVREPRLWMRGAACTEARWTYLGPSASHDLVRGDVSWLTGSAALVDLGAPECLAEAWPGLRWTCDETLPPGGGSWYYLVRLVGESGDWGRSAAMAARDAGDPCP